MASIGFAVGLGNIWKFPYVAGENGGAAFVLVYLICVFFVATPIVIAEMVIGRRGRSSVVGSMRKVAMSAGRSPGWSFVGWWASIAVFLILTYYCVIGAWTLDYIFKALFGKFSGIDSLQSVMLYQSLLANPLRMILMTGLFLGLLVFVVSRGIKKGIEKAVTILMPALFASMAVLGLYALFVGDATQGIKFLFSPDWSKLTGKTVLTAIGHAFFSVGVASAVMIAYAAYLPKNVNIGKSALIIAGTDTVVALFAGLTIFPLVFAFNLEPGDGAGLIFMTLPVAFGQMPLGALFSTAFFTLLAFAAFTSAIADLEVMVAWADEHHGMSRRKSAALAGLVAWALSLLTIFSFSIWSDVHPLNSVPMFRGMDFYTLIDYITAYIMLPLGGLMISVFAGWFLPRRTAMEEIGAGDGLLFKLWRFLIRYLIPIAIAAMFLNGILA